MRDPRETLARIRAQADAATEGPWAPWRDQDGALHMNGLLMVGNAAAVIPEGESWVEGVDVNPIAHTYTPEDREFIAASRTTVPALLDLADAVLERHAPMPIYVLAEDCEAPDDHQHGSTPDGGDDLCWDEPTGEVLCCECRDEWGERVEHPCPDYTAITTITRALEGETRD